MVKISTILLSISIIFSQCEASIMIRDKDESMVVKYISLGALFGSHPIDPPLVGYLRRIHPEDACNHVFKSQISDRNQTMVLISNGKKQQTSSSSASPLTLKESNNYDTIAMIQRGGCNFDEKVLNVQKAGFKGAIVYNQRSSQRLVRMSGNMEYSSKIIIPAMMVGYQDSGFMLLKYTGNINFTAEMDFTDEPDPAINAAGILIPFAIVIAVCFLLMLVLIVYRWYRDYRKTQRGRLPIRDLKRLATKRFHKGDAFDTCAICLDDYEENEKVRMLPCEHLYHIKCIDHWLTKRKRNCPICKRKVFASESDSDSDIYSSSDEDQYTGTPGGDESSPLLQQTSDEEAGETQRSTGPHRLIHTFRDYFTTRSVLSSPSQTARNNTSSILSSPPTSPNRGGYGSTLITDGNESVSSEVSDLLDLRDDQTAPPTIDCDVACTSSQAIKRG